VRAAGPARRNHGSSAPFGDGVAARAHVKGLVDGDTCGLLTGRGLAGPHGRIAAQTLAGSHQIASAPPRCNALFDAGKFGTLQAGVFGLLVAFSDHAGFTR
jgi:hypothetical protein